MKRRKKILFFFSTQGCACGQRLVVRAEISPYVQFGVLWQVKKAAFQLGQA